MPTISVGPKEKEINRCGLNFTDRVVFITGGAKGIGEGCARVFADAGARVVICDRDREAGAALAKELSERGPGTCHFEVADISQPEDIRRVIARTIELHGRLDCLLNNAGIHPAHKPIDQHSAEELLEAMQINLVGYFVAAQYALPHLRKTNGSVINIGSIVGEIGELGATAYCATKGAIHGFTKALALEEARFGVRVNAILPGNILSHGRKSGIAAMPPEEGAVLDKWVDSLQCAGRSGTCEEVGQLCLFLASDAASYITGALIPITGGTEVGYGPKHPPRFIGEAFLGSAAD